MPRDATNTPAGHTSALGELFIADEWVRVQAKVYKFDSGTFFRNSGALGFVEHTLAQDVVGAGLIAFAAFFQPGDHIGVEAHRDSLLQGTIKPAADCVFPCMGREFWDIGGVDLVVGDGGEGGEFSFLAGRQSSSAHPLPFYFGFRFSNCLRHKFSVQCELLFGRK